MPVRAPQFSIVLAAGKGTRMRSVDLHKVCFPIDGVPAINRAIDTYNAAGIAHNIIVVGALAGQVMETVGARFDNLSFAYQAEQRGTAHATRIGLAPLLQYGGDQDVLVVAGDRIIEAAVLEQLFDLFYSENCDLALLATPHAPGSSQGRIIETADGRLIGIVEDADIRQRQALADVKDRLNADAALPSRAEIASILRSRFSRNGALEVSETKLATAFGPLWEWLHITAGDPDRATFEQYVSACADHDFRFAQEDGSTPRLSPAEVDRAERVNNSVYLVRISALRYALERLDTNNAQREEYLSEIVAILAAARTADEGREFRCRALAVDDARHVMGFNDPAELLEVESFIRARRERTAVEADLPACSWHRPVGDWIALFETILENRQAVQDPLAAELEDTYGNDAEVIGERVRAFLAILAKASEQLGPHARVLLVRSPGRINVLSRHIDHQGGNCNLMTIGFETLMVARARGDDTIRLAHVDPDAFPERRFSISELVQDLPWEDWLSLVNSEKVSKLLHTYGGDWSQYVTAAVLRLQKKFSGRKLRGMDLIVAGNIPMAAGLSSSSSLVVGAADATIAVNQLLSFPSQVVDLCGEGEWFVGTRGGAADHAAVKLGQKGKVIKVRFFDFGIEEVISFPDDYVMAVCDSGIRAEKSGAAKDQFNHRVCCYRVGFELIKAFFPQFAPVLHHLRDVNVRNLRLPLSWIYRILLHLPEAATRDELRRLLPNVELDGVFANHAPPADGIYPVRGVVLFGLAECERARLYADCLKAGRMQDIGRLMAVSHDGDRVATFDANLNEASYVSPTSNAYLLGLMDDLESGDPERVLSAQLQWQPGSYHCSLPPIDKMVDVSTRTPGVVGAQLAGAGLGGCMMVLAHRNATEALMRNLDKHYYAPRRQPASVLICKPVAGAGVLLLDRG